MPELTRDHRKVLTESSRTIYVDVNGHKIVKHFQYILRILVMQQ